MRRLAIGAVVCVAALAACSREPADTGRPKLVIIGFDGLDPDLVQQYMKDGHLPAFSRLVAGGGAYPLETTVSPESPTAWASFATGVNPGKHNIYDFLVRDTNTYLPDLGMVRREPPRFLFDWVPIRRPRVVSLRGGTSFWVTAGGAGVRSSVLTVPITFPPEEVPNGELLSGLPLPDLRGTMGTFYYFATDLSRYEEGNTEFGGILRRLIFDGQTARAQLVGPPNPIVRTKIQAIRRKGPLTDADRTTVAELEAKEDVTLPMSVTWTRGSKSAAITLAGQTVTLTPGTWSKWIDLDVPRQPVRPIARHGAAVPDRRRIRNCSSTSRRSTSSRTRRRWRSHRQRASRPISTSGSDRSARSDGPRRRGRSTKGAWTKRRSWTTSTKRSTTARRSSSID